jgi:hypothetical protein
MDVGSKHHNVIIVAPGEVCASSQTAGMKGQRSAEDEVLPADACLYCRIFTVAVRHQNRGLMHWQAAFYRQT